MSKSRSERRHHHERMINRVKNFSWIKSWLYSEEHIKKMAETRKPCSCYMCCNPRRSDWNKEKLTMQERRAMESLKDEC